MSKISKNLYDYLKIVIIYIGVKCKRKGSIDL